VGPEDWGAAATAVKEAAATAVKDEAATTV